MISIIVPVYLVESYLEQCLNSILCQTYRDLEILLIDDGSPDQCGEICDRYAAADSRISVFHTENKGLSSARNLGLNHAHGEYIGFVDGDDWIEPDMYERLLDAVEKTGANIGVCGRVMEHPDKKEIILPVSGVLGKEKAVRALALLEIRNPAWDKLWKRDCFDSIRFPEGKVYEDIATTYRIFLQAKLVVGVPMALYHYRIHEGSISQNDSISYLIDYYESNRAEYESIALVSPYNRDEAIRKALLNRCGSAVIQLWKEYSSASKQDQKKYLHVMRDAARFVRDNYPFFGYQSWPVMRRLHMILCRNASWWSFAVVGIKVRISRGFRRR